MIPATEGRLPPRGWVLIEDQKGRRFWADPGKMQRSAERRTLTEKQLGRIRAFKEILGPHDPTSLDETVSNFKRDEDPDAEISIWEQIAHVFHDEVRARGEISMQEQHLIYFASLLCSTVGPNRDHLLSGNPRLKGLKNLDAVIARWQSLL